MRTLLCLSLIALSTLASHGVGTDHTQWSHTYDLDLTAVWTVPAQASMAGNCVYLDGTDHRMSGTATVEWIAQTPLTEWLELVLLVDIVPVARAQGPSPLTLPFHDIDLRPHEIGSAVFSWQLPYYGAAINQTGTMTLELAYTGTGPLQDHISGCPNS